jgi:hypothetical protein
LTAHLIIKYNASKTISAVPKLIPNSSNISLPLPIPIYVFVLLL